MSYLKKSKQLLLTSSRYLSENVKYMHIATEVKDEMDVTVDDVSQIGYEICGSDSNYFNLFSMICWFCKYTW